MSTTGGGGGLLTTEVLTTDLGTHGGRRLRARVQRRTLRFALGAHVRGSFVRLRPLAVEVDDTREVGSRLVAIEVPVDPYLQAAQRIVVLWIAAFALRLVASRLRRAWKAA